MNENANGPPLDMTAAVPVTTRHTYAATGNGSILCWVCEEKVSKPAHYRDRRGDVRIVHNWCIAGATTKDRRLFVEENRA